MRRSRTAEFWRANKRRIVAVILVLFVFVLVTRPFEDPVQLDLAYPPDADSVLVVPRISDVARDILSAKRLVGQATEPPLAEWFRRETSLDTADLIKLAQVYAGDTSESLFRWPLSPDMVAGFSLWIRRRPSEAVETGRYERLYGLRDQRDDWPFDFGLTIHCDSSWRAACLRAVRRPVFASLTRPLFPADWGIEWDGEVMSCRAPGILMPGEWRNRWRPPAALFATFIGENLHVSTDRTWIENLQKLSSVNEAGRPWQAGALQASFHPKAIFGSSGLLTSLLGESKSRSLTSLLGAHDTGRINVSAHLGADIMRFETSLPSKLMNQPMSTPAVQAADERGVLIWRLSGRDDLISLMDFTLPSDEPLTTTSTIQTVLTRLAGMLDHSALNLAGSFWAPPIDEDEPRREYWPFFELSLPAADNKIAPIIEREFPEYLVPPLAGSWRRLTYPSRPASEETLAIGWQENRLYAASAPPPWPGKVGQASERLSGVFRFALGQRSLNRLLQHCARVRVDRIRAPAADVVEDFREVCRAELSTLYSAAIRRGDPVDLEALMAPRIEEWLTERTRSAEKVRSATTLFLEGIQPLSGGLDIQGKMAGDHLVITMDWAFDPKN